MKQMLRSAGLVFSFWQFALAAKTHSAPALVASSSQRQSASKDRLFTIVHEQECKGNPFTQNALINCDGWSGLTEADCEKKCHDNERAPNCPQETCHAAVFYPMGGICHLYKECDLFEPALGAMTLIDQEELGRLQDKEREMMDEHQDPGPNEELLAAMPLVLINLTAFSTSLHNTDVPQAYLAGNMSADKETLYDKVSGFLIVLRERMNPGDGDRYCPFRNESVISRCIMIATCIIQKVVPQEISMEAHAALMEQVSRFEDITWPLLTDTLIFASVHDAPSIPEDYNCDGEEVADPHSLATPALLQMEAKAVESTKFAETLALSAAMNHASVSTRRILDAHGLNSSMHSTGMQLEKLWHHICQKLPCNPSNMYDVFLAWHKQSMALFQTSAVGHLHHEIRQRQRFYNRLQHFISDHFSERVHFFDDDTALPGSKESVVEYGKGGRAAVLGVMIPHFRKLASAGEERALRLVDRVQFYKFLQNEAKEEKMKARQSLKFSIGSESDEDEDDLEDSEHDEDQQEDAEEDDVHDVPEPPPVKSASLVSESETEDFNTTDGVASGRWSKSWCNNKKTMVFYNHRHKHYVRMSNTRVERGPRHRKANIPYGWTWERFTCVDLGNGFFAFHNTFHNRFMRMNSNGKIDLSDKRDRDKLPNHWHWERFKMKDMGNGWALWSTSFNKFVKMDHGEALVVSDRRDNMHDIPSGWDFEKFEIQEAGAEVTSASAYWFIGRTVAIWNHQHQHYLRMYRGKQVEKGGHGWRDPFPGSWGHERFVPVMAGHGEVAFYNTEHRRFIRMNDHGRMDSSDQMDKGDLHDKMTWERFKVIPQPNGHFYFYNMHFKKFVKMVGWEKTVIVSNKMDYWDAVGKDWGNEKLFIQEVGEKKNCNWWCRMRRGLEKVVKFVEGLVKCFGKWSFATSIGYGKSFSPHAAINFGATGGMGVGTMKELLQGKTPSVSISAWAALGVGATVKWAWSGVGVALYISCGGTLNEQDASCNLGVTVGAILSAWHQAWGDPKCAFGPTILGAFECARSIGGTMLLMCCNFNLMTGHSDCPPP